MPFEALKVGELARRTGLTVRTLHHYDAIGLLRPSGRTDSAHGSGHRLYTAADVARLQQILSLKHLGFGLEQIVPLSRRVAHAVATQAQAEGLVEPCPPEDLDRRIGAHWWEPRYRRMRHRV